MKIYSLKNFQHRLQINRHYFKTVEIVNSFSDISWKDIFLRKFRITSIPRTKSISSATDKLKVFFIKILFLTTSHSLRIKNLNEIFFGSPNRNTLYVCGAHGFNIYKIHLPHFHIVETLGKYPKFALYVYLAISLFSNKDKSKGISVFTNPPTPLILRIYSSLHPNKRIIIRFHDILRDNDIKIIKTIKNKFPNFIIESYSRLDAKNHNLLFRPNGVNIEYMRGLDEGYRTNIASFSGSTETKKPSLDFRQKPLESIYNQLKVIYKNADEWFSKKLARNSSDYIPYSEYVKISTFSEIYIDLFRVSQNEGFSFRIPEGLALNRKIITNRESIKNETFYNSNRVFILGRDNLDNLRNFLESKTPDPLHESVLKYYDSTRWWTPQDPYQK